MGGLSCIMLVRTPIRNSWPTSLPEDQTRIRKTITGGRRSILQLKQVASIESLCSCKPGQKQTFTTHSGMPPYSARCTNHAETAALLKRCGKPAQIQLTRITMTFRR